MVLVRSYDFIIAKGKRESNNGVFAFFQPMVVNPFSLRPAKRGNVGKAVDMASKMRYNK